MLTMFVMLTLENVPDQHRDGPAGSPSGPPTRQLHVLHQLHGDRRAFLIFNLFIGIVLNSMEEARSADRKEHETDDLLTRLRTARTALEDAEAELQKTHRDDKNRSIAATRREAY